MTRNVRAILLAKTSFGTLKNMNMFYKEKTIIL
jgi:hypothetical protein